MSKQIGHFHLFIIDIITQAHIRRYGHAYRLAIKTRVPITEATRHGVLQIIRAFKYRETLAQTNQHSENY